MPHSPLQVGIVYLAVPVVLIAALAVVFWHFYRTLDAKIAALLARPVEEYRYAQPADTLDTYPAIVSTSEDVVGAWALEQERLGFHVSDEEMATQRRMWAAEV